MPETMTFGEFLASAWLVVLRWFPIWLVGAVLTAYLIRFSEWDGAVRVVGSIFWPIFWFYELMMLLMTRPALWLMERFPIWLARLDRWVSVASATKLQEDDYGELLQGRMPGGIRARWLRVKDETGTHIIRADPQMDTAHQAVAASFNKRASEYAPDAES